MLAGPEAQDMETKRLAVSKRSMKALTTEPALQWVSMTILYKFQN
jgi:hypothetical protein